METATARRLNVHDRWLILRTADDGSPSEIINRTLYRHRFDSITAALSLHGYGHRGRVRKRSWDRMRRAGFRAVKVRVIVDE